ncbi:hypothetical protein IAT40_003381 [Kwoniella sp. CBS 6097]
MSINTDTPTASTSTPSTGEDTSGPNISVDVKADERSRLPFELITSIFQLVETPSTLAALARVNKSIAELVNDRLYCHVTLDHAPALILFHTQVPPEKKQLVKSLTIKHGQASDPAWQLPSVLPTPMNIDTTSHSSDLKWELGTLCIKTMESPVSQETIPPPSTVGDDMKPNNLFDLWLPAVLPDGGPVGVLASRHPSNFEDSDSIVKSCPQTCDKATLKSIVRMFSKWDNLVFLVLWSHCLDFSDHEDFPLVALHRCLKLRWVNVDVHYPDTHCEGELHKVVEDFFDRRDELEGPKSNGFFMWVANQQVRFPQHTVHSHPVTGGHSHGPSSGATGQREEGEEHDPLPIHHWTSLIRPKKEEQPADDEVTDEEDSNATADPSS